MRLGAIEVRRTSTGLRITPRFKQLSEPATDSQPQNTTVEEMFEQVETDDFSMLDKLVDVALSKVNAFDFSEAAGSADEVQRNTTKLVVQARLDQVKVAGKNYLSHKSNLADPLDVQRAEVGLKNRLQAGIYMQPGEKPFVYWMKRITM